MNEESKKKMRGETIEEMRKATNAVAFYMSFRKKCYIWCHFLAYMQKKCYLCTLLACEGKTTKQQNIKVF